MGNYGVITEQGFATGNGLGFKVINEEELKKPNKDKDNKEDKSK